MDNLSSHKVAGVSKAIEGADAQLLYLPPYSPDLNPIEMLFAKLKAIIRAIAARTVEALWKALGIVSGQVPPTECANFIRRAGYVRSGRRGSNKMAQGAGPLWPSMEPPAPGRCVTRARRCLA
jgi:hypothetical protein